MARLERAEVLLSFERSLSPAAMGFPIEAFIHVTVRQADLPRIRIDLERIPEILQAHGMSGQIDLVVRVACRDTRHLFDVDARILAVAGVARPEPSLVLRAVIPSRFAPPLGRDPRARAPAT